MAATSRALTLKLLADISDFTKGIDQSQKQVTTMGDKISKFGKAAGVALLAAGAAAVAFGAKAIQAGEAAATSNARIDQINKSMGLFGESTDEVTASLVSYANQVARSTGIDQNAIKATQAKLLTFKELAVTADEVGGNFERATKAAIDLGAAGFGTAEDNAVSLGKALNDPIRGITALTRNGITFTESEKERIKVLVESNKVGEAQNLILAAIETQVGGTAEATSNATDRMKVGLSQVTETIGMALLPAFEKVTAFLLDEVFPAFQAYVLPIVKELAAFLQDNFSPLLQNVFIPIVKSLIEAWTTVANAVRRNEKELTPLLNLFKAVFEFVKVYLAPLLVNVLGKALQAVAGVVSTLISLFSNLVGIINAAVNAIKAVASAGKAIGGAIGGALGFGGGRAMGGPVSARTAYVVGERGPELFVPSSSGSIIPNGGMGGGTIINLTVNGAIDSESTARQIVSILNDSQARGTLGSLAFA
jgi:phage-related protein